MKKAWLVPVLLCMAFGAFAQDALAQKALAQDAGKNALPVTAVSLYSSGIGYYEHTGSVRDSATVPLVFDASAINDVLKSLVVSDQGGGVPSVRYPAEDTLIKTLQSLSIDLSGAFSLADILAGMRGAEIRISGPAETVGRIVCVERKGPSVPSGTSGSSGDLPGKDYLTVSTGSGLASYDLAEIPSFSFTDPTVEADLARALDLIAATRNDASKTLLVTLPGKGPRNVTLGYVAPAPVWKASYRLDLSGDGARVQGWAIIDNTGEMDWQNIRLSLVTGKPVSFIQNLYAPYYFQRPVLPLAIAGAAEAMTYGSGVENEYALQESADMDYAPAPSAAPAPKMSKSIRASSAAGDAVVEWSEENGALSTGAESGDFFSYTMPTPVSIPRRQSAMLPFVEAKIAGEKMSVFTAGSKHPMFCVQLTNTSGMKLPAGPVTVFDDGSYSGDALVEFFPQNDKRILAFGEDLAVSCAENSSVAGRASSMTVSKGVLTIARKNVYTKTYDFVNADAKDRKLVVEHPITQGATLASPTKFRESTVASYRFDVSLPANGKATLTVREEKPDWRNVSLVSLDAAALLSYSTSSDVSAQVKAALERAVALKRKTDDANAELQAALTRKGELVENQGRIRDNLTAAGNETQQGKDYLKKLAQADVEIDKASEDIALARKKVADANDAFKNYISTLDLK